jgi:hypothetical protein
MYLFKLKELLVKIKLKGDLEAKANPLSIIGEKDLLK